MIAPHRIVEDGRWKELLGKIPYCGEGSWGCGEVSYRRLAFVRCGMAMMQKLGASLLVVSKVLINSFRGNGI